MITVCPKCALTLAVTAGDLRVGQGQVRCGRCAAVFNALAALQDDLSETIERPRPDSLMPDPQNFDPSKTDVSKAVATPTAAAPPMETPHAAHMANAPATDSASMPQTAEPVAEIPVAESPVADSALAASNDVFPAEAPAPESTLTEPVAIEEPAEDALPPAANDASAEAPLPANDDHIDPVAANEEIHVDVESIVVQPVAPDPADSASIDLDLAAVSPEEQDALPDNRSELELPPADAGGYPNLDLDLTPPAPAHRRQAWAWGSVFLLLLLGVQYVHNHRNTLAARDNLRGPLQSIYGVFGARLQPAWNAGAFTVLRRGEIIADNDGAMTLRATVQNTAPNSQPLPLLRVVLLDRFGARIAARDLLPAEYLPAAAAANLPMLAAGQRIDAEVALADPGPAATGFELDACLRLSADQLQCASRAAARR